MELRNDKGKRPTSNQEWIAWGEMDPLYGVATLHGRSHMGSDPWTDEQFYELGASDWDRFRAQWEKYGLQQGTCVEIGCGAGRLTMPMARFFKTVHGLDVSPGMIEYAKRHVPANVSLHVTDGLEIPLPERSANAIFSTHVLQHFSNLTAAVAYFREVHRVLVPGGTLMIHIPIIAWPWGSLLGIHKLIHKTKILLDSWHAQLMRFAFRLRLVKTPPMQITWYEISWLYQTLEALGFSNIEVRILFGESKMAVQHPFVFATRPY
jgi:ubiquinone/menaquinone biosynthesis C-methylase UbiE